VIGVGGGSGAWLAGVVAGTSVTAGTDDDPMGITTGLTPEARILVAVAGIGAVVFILVLLRRRQLRSKYALVWTGLAVVLGVLGLFPGLLTWVSEAVGIYYPPALFLLVATGFLFAIVIQFSWELSRLEERTRTLAEELALRLGDPTAPPSPPLRPPPDTPPGPDATLEGGAPPPAGPPPGPAAHPESGAGAQPGDTPGA
jgi:hypothetical protein